MQIYFWIIILGGIFTELWPNPKNRKPTEFYNKALRLQSSNEFSEAEEILLKLINENIPQLENHGGLPSSMSTLKYSCYCNIYIKKDDPESPLDCYLNTSELDATHVTLWYKIGKLAI